MNILELSEQEIVRRNSLNRLREMGIDAYPAEEFVVDAWSEEVKANFSDDEAEPRQVRMAGRVMSRRIMGKASFMELQDSKGRIQVYVNRDELCPDEDKTLYNEVFKKLLDIGDFVGVTGFVFRTQTGEISIHAKSLKLLSKSLKPLPIVKQKDGVTYDAFDDPELRYRQRYVDLIVNDGVKDTFLKRATIVKTLRSVLDKAGYTEVETPTLQSHRRRCKLLAHSSPTSMRSTFLCICVSPPNSTSSALSWAVLKVCTKSARTSATRVWTATTTLSSPAWNSTFNTRTTTG